MNFAEITSRKNEKIIWASKLSDKKTRDKEKVFFTEGAKLLEEVILSGLCIKRLFFTKKAHDSFGTLLDKAACDECYLVSDEVYEKITDETSPQGIFACIEKPDSVVFSDSDIKNGSFIILEDIQNPQNLGAIFRCAHSLGASRLMLSSRCADVYSPKTLRSSMGSVFKCDFSVCDDLPQFIEKLKSQGNDVYCTHLHSKAKTLGSFDFKPSDSLVIGNEGNGISKQVLDCCTHSVIIPMVKNAESLNAATASSILIWEMNKNKLLPRK